ncbi:hypothetical protein E1193_06895 [Micromonospora sp. KC606]|uniref:TolB family protein n=1 Tax=Micromonospora sp. KC606 TaxID=2530379 RepID=UPI00104FC31E|nr:PD40 domain-containing protein [Micromonospora sp. KC606]TDC84120.1 hypothetical protein E1193_06895 [Micromonospora sp. KC606]
MNNQRLRLDLADLAEEVTPVDLRDRALRTSRRIGIRRAVATSAAAVALLGAATGTAFAIRPDAAPAPLPGGPPSVAASPTAADPWSGVGRLFYAPQVSQKANNALAAWRPGGQLTTLVDLPGSLLEISPAVSPDGTQVAWVQDRDLMLADLDGPNRAVVHSGVEGSCWGPSWVPHRGHPEGRETPETQWITVAVRHNPGKPLALTRGLVDPKTESFQFLQIEEDSCHPVWSADGRFLAYTDGSGQVVVMNWLSKVIHVVPRLGGSNSFHSYEVASLSPDGSRVALLRIDYKQEGANTGRNLSVNTILDTRTGATVELPLGGRKLLQAYFLPNDRLVARVRATDGTRLLLIDSDGRRVTEAVEPAALEKHQILAVTSS